MKTTALAVISSLALLLMATPALPAPALETAAGTWRGSGWVKRDDAEAKQAVRCRITTAYDAPRLAIDGKCAASGTNFQVKGYVDEKDGHFSGRWYNPFGASVAPVTGLLKRKTVDLTFRFPPEDTASKAVSGHLEWIVGSDELVLSSTRGDNAPLSEIVFER